ncbi:hypothetical protein [Lewinella sp. LCG006]|uniref:hypothetical protein n=1 Tax=Lewinella sp. LCG006 TaxID=3231911 RepID=UPI00345FC80B
MKAIKILLLIGLSIFVIKFGEIALRYLSEDYRNRVRVKAWNKGFREFQEEESENEKKKDTIYQDEEFLFIANKDVKVDVIRKGEQKELKSKGDTLFSDGYVSFLGDLDNEPEIFIRYHPRYKFEDFPIDVYEGELSSPDFSTNKDAKRFVTRITEESKRRPNFAGKLNFINWGCGTNCQSGVILNSATGEIYKGIVTAWGFNSKPNSRLLIVDYGLFENKEKEWLPFCGYCIPKYGSVH